MPLEIHQSAVLRERELWTLLRRAKQRSEMHPNGDSNAVLAILRELGSTTAAMVRSLVALGVVVAHGMQSCPHQAQGVGAGRRQPAGLTTIALPTAD